ncbi:hypothetical protein C1752_02186 [Acaryochloris thomasi RCC1774]|uniref:Uncharacterized protein n=1 Tax=Acaryochloris thomasi RCC1774 TaxID=1764569 RepID=A0A2W1JPN9_9CYAN|nr:hypothetical protein C1752_02186 [Acaryochloris thomasi RCC1774]
MTAGTEEANNANNKVTLPLFASLLYSKIEILDFLSLSL